MEINDIWLVILVCGSFFILCLIGLLFTYLDAKKYASNRMSKIDLAARKFAKKKKGEYIGWGRDTLLWGYDITSVQMKYKNKIYTYYVEPDSQESPTILYDKVM